MKTRSVCRATTLFCLVAMSSLFVIQPVAAQAPRPSPIRIPTRRPTTSPYLNLLNNNNNNRIGIGNNIGFNYYQRVRPEQEFRRANQQLSRSIGNLREEVRYQSLAPQSGRSQLGPTGHSSRFLNLGTYFPLSRRR